MLATWGRNVRVPCIWYKDPEGEFSADCKSVGVFLEHYSLAAFAWCVWSLAWWNFIFCAFLCFLSEPSEFGCWTEVMRMECLVLSSVWSTNTNPGRRPLLGLCYESPRKLCIWQFICICRNKVFWFVLPNWEKMPNLPPWFLKHRDMGEAQDGDSKQDLVIVGEEDFCFKLPAAYVRPAPLLCLWLACQYGQTAR